MTKSRLFRVIPLGTVTSVQGFSSCGIALGIKPGSNKKDFGLVVSDCPAVAAGTFTTSAVKAAPVQVTMANLKASRGMVKAIVANSGNANACTGVQGIADAKETAGLVALTLGCKDSQVLVCSTGRIGRPLPMSIIRKGVHKAVTKLSNDAGLDFAEAIMTSDTRPKHTAVKLQVDGLPVTIGVCAKGAGMIDPNMATMLCFITTDAAIYRRTLLAVLQEVVELSFNRILVDGDMSTNDTVLCLANGQAGNNPLCSYHPDLQRFKSALLYCCTEMAKAIVLDGERVTKCVEVAVKGAVSSLHARQAARAIATSLLVKSSWFGNDPNWGRLMAALGYSGCKLKEELVDIYYDGVLAVKGGVASTTPAVRLKKIVSKKSFRITINLHMGESEHTIYTTDLTDEYVNYNKSE
jgi:glutamate N-acetyltransferase/amino-acid N-acetyltransferase